MYEKTWKYRIKTPFGVYVSNDDMLGAIFDEVKVLWFTGILEKDCYDGKEYKVYLGSCQFLLEEL